MNLEKILTEVWIGFDALARSIKKRRRWKDVHSNAFLDGAREFFAAMNEVGPVLVEERSLLIRGEDSRCC